MHSGIANESTANPNSHYQERVLSNLHAISEPWPLCWTCLWHVQCFFPFKGSQIFCIVFLLQSLLFSTVACNTTPAHSAQRSRVTYPLSLLLEFGLPVIKINCSLVNTSNIIKVIWFWYLNKQIHFQKRGTIC